MNRSRKNKQWKCIQCCDNSSVLSRFCLNGSADRELELNRITTIRCHKVAMKYIHNRGLDLVESIA
jgi:hypothetical protein